MRGGPERPVPGRRLVAVLASELATEVEFAVTVSGVVNINDVPDGGGETSLLRQAPEPAPEPDVPPGPAPDPPPTPNPGGGS